MERSLVRGGDLRISMVLPAGVDPFIRVPGVGLEDTGAGGVGDTGTGAVSSTQRRSGDFSVRRHGARRLSPGSGILGSGVETLEAVERIGAGDDMDGAESDDEVGAWEEDSGEVPEAMAVGLTVELRVLAPMISVLLVHDDGVSSPILAGSPGTRGGSGATSGGVDGRSGGHGHAGAGEVPRASSSLVEDGAGEGVGEGVVEGALVLVELQGLQVGCRVSSGDGYGVGVLDDTGLGGPEEAGSLVANEPERPGLSLSIASFRVRDMHQRVGREFSYLLSSTAPPWPLPQSPLEPRAEPHAPAMCSLEEDGSCQGARVTAADAGESAIRITRAIADGRGPPRTLVVLAGVWANWNPETVAALSIFAYGMYGTKAERAEPAAEGGLGGESVDGCMAGVGVSCEMEVSRVSVRPKRVIDGVCVRSLHRLSWCARSLGDVVPSRGTALLRVG